MKKERETWGEKKKKKHIYIIPTLPRNGEIEIEIEIEKKKNRKI